MVERPVHRAMVESINQIGHVDGHADHRRGGRGRARPWRRCGRSASTTRRAMPSPPPSRSSTGAHSCFHLARSCVLVPQAEGWLHDSSFEVEDPVHSESGRPALRAARRRGGEDGRHPAPRRVVPPAAEARRAYGRAAAGPRSGPPTSSCASAPARARARGLRHPAGGPARAPACPTTSAPPIPSSAPPRPPARPLRRVGDLRAGVRGAYLPDPGRPLAGRTPASPAASASRWTSPSASGPKRPSTARRSAQVTLASIGDGVIRTDNEGQIDYLNPVAETAHRLGRRRGARPAAHRSLPGHRRGHAAAARATRSTLPRRGDRWSSRRGTPCCSAPTAGVLGPRLGGADLRSRTARRWAPSWSSRTSPSCAAWSAR